MGQFVVCSHCNRILEVPEKGGAERLVCPGCQRRILLPAASAEEAGAQEQATRFPCPQCQSPLKLVRQLAGLRVRCNTCQTSFLVSVDPWKLTAVAAGIPHDVGYDPDAEAFDDGLAPLFLDEDEEVPLDGYEASGGESPTDREVAVVVAAWPQLPLAMRIGILAMVRAVTEDDSHPLDFLH